MWITRTTSHDFHYYFLKMYASSLFIKVIADNKQFFLILGIYCIWPILTFVWIRLCVFSSTLLLLFLVVQQNWWPAFQTVATLTLFVLNIILFTQENTLSTVRVMFLNGCIYHSGWSGAVHAQKYVRYTHTAIHTWGLKGNVLRLDGIGL